MTATMRKSPTLVKKADVSVPVPGGAARFSTIGSGKATSRMLAVKRRGQYDIYYQMFRQHPTLRAAIEKIAKTTVGNGYMFSPFDQELDLPKPRATQLHNFFRKSGGIKLLRLIAKDIGIYGESYMWVEKTLGGVPIRGKRLHPKYVDPKSADDVNITSYRYTTMPDDEKGITYDAKVIIHFSLEDPDDDLHGLSLLASLQHTIANDLFAIEFNGKFFENSAQTGMIFNMKGASVDEVERNRAWLEDNYVGASNAHRPLILEGDITVQKASQSAAEMQFLEGRTFNRQEILSVLDIPPEKLQITGNSNRSTGKESDNSFRSESISGWQSILEEEINDRLIFDMFGWDDIVFRFRESSKRDLIEMTKMLAELARMGVWSVNEIRGEFGLSNVAGGNVHAIQSAAGVIPLEMIDEVASRLIANPVANPAAGSAATGVGTQAGGRPAAAAPVGGGKGHPGAPRTPGKPGRPGHSGEPGTPGTSGGRGSA